MNALSLAELIRLRRAELRELEAILEDRRVDHVDWIDQTQSTLGPRRHCKAVKARIAARLPGAALVGRRHLLSPAALAETLSSTRSKPNAPAEAEQPASVAAELEAALGLRVVGGGRR